MTAEGFKEWRQALKLSQAEAATLLGLSKPTVENYEKGVRRDTGEPVIIPKYIALACAAIFHRLHEWGDYDDRAPS